MWKTAYKICNQNAKIDVLFFSAQKHTPSEGDWIFQIKRDMADLKLELSEAEIKAMSNYQFKNLIRKKIEKLAMSNLNLQKKLEYQGV